MGTEGQCDGCQRLAILTPLHGSEKGGPLRCYVCAGAVSVKIRRPCFFLGIVGFCESFTCKKAAVPINLISCKLISAAGDSLLPSG